MLGDLMILTIILSHTVPLPPLKSLNLSIISHIRLQFFYYSQNFFIFFGVFWLHFFFTTQEKIYKEKLI